MSTTMEHGLPRWIVYYTPTCTVVYGPMMEMDEKRAWPCRQIYQGLSEQKAQTMARRLKTPLQTMVIS